jgi:type I restriction enzyme M protein
MDEGTLFRTTETAFVQTKRKLLNECNLWCIVSLPAGVFINAGAASKTNLLFFTKGQETREVWYYDLSGLNVTKKQPLTMEHFEEFFKLLPERVPSERSWSVPVEELKTKNYDLKAINPNRKQEEDTRTPAELLSIIEAQGIEISNSLSALRHKGL